LNKIGDKMTNTVIETIMKRRSTRAYTDEQVKDADINQIIEAGLNAPSAHNYQSWHFTVIQNKEMIAKINHEARLVAQNHSNEGIRKMGNNAKTDFFYKAPTLILVSGDENGLMPTTDCAAATQNMLLAAESLGLGNCWVGFAAFAFAGDNGDSLKAELGIPADFKPHFAVLLGYKKNPDGNAPKRKENNVNYVR
jgi:nitroreductase